MITPKNIKKSPKAPSSKPHSSRNTASSSKTRIVIKNKVSQKRDISEHFGVSKSGSRTNSSKIHSGINRKSSKNSYLTNNTKIQNNSSNLIMQTAPPTAAQARERTMRTSGHSRKDRNQLKDSLSQDSVNDELETNESNASLAPKQSAIPSKIEIMESIQIGNLAKKMNLRPNEIIGRLMRMGEMVTINKSIDAETVTLLAADYNCEVKVVSLYDDTLIKEENRLVEEEIERPPIVTIMGHVDHGKTMLLDTIRTSKVIDTEAGAITQHIGAYQVDTNGNKITFLDTPGHEAFSAMRVRGASVTDIVILVVAADDGVKQQTIEAIAHAREAKVPIIVAVNKIDLPDANLENVKKALSEHGLAAEDWGGDTVYCPISAKENKGIDELLKAILLQAEMLNLKANPKMRATGYVLEANVDLGKGSMATILLNNGTLNEGDIFVVGSCSGRIRAIYNDIGKSIKTALPSTPVKITGIDSIPETGDPFQVVENEKYGREVASKRQHYKQINSVTEAGQPSLDDLGSWVKTHKELKVIIKTDVQGTVEAIQDGIQRLSTKDVKVRVVHGATGAISESDVNLGLASHSIIIGFQVRATQRVSDLAERSGVDIKYYNVIYNIIDDIKQSMEGLLEPERIEEITGTLEVRQVFKISKFGNIAGCMVISGNINRNNTMRVIRDGIVIYTGNIKSLRRLKEDVTEVKEGFECGIAFENFNDLKEKDQLENFHIKEVARKL